MLALVAALPLALGTARGLPVGLGVILSPSLSLTLSLSLAVGRDIGLVRALALVLASALTISYDVTLEITHPLGRFFQLHNTRGSHTQTKIVVLEPDLSTDAWLNVLRFCTLPVFVKRQGNQPAKFPLFCLC